MDNINKKIASLQPYVPGKPIDETAAEYGISAPIKLASNENPRGPSHSVQEAIRGAISALSRYPDGSGTRLKSALAEAFDVSADQLTLGNGSNDVLDLAAKVAIEPGCNGVVDKYCFVVYPLAITACAGDVVSVSSKNWSHNLDGFLEAISNRTRIVYIANPNNPTGSWVTDDELCRFLDRCPSRVWVVLDEAYYEYACINPKYPDGVALTRQYANLIVTRTFSKVYGLAGLRIGYSVSSAEFADLMNRVRHPFNTNSVALAAAEAALSDSAYLDESVRLNETGIAQLTEGFRRLSLHSIPSLGNFVSVKIGSNAQTVYEKLLRHGVIVRPIANYGMPEYLRITVGLPRENEAFLHALETVL